MASDKTVTVDTDRLMIPSELYEAMGTPRALLLADRDDEGGRFVSAAGLVDRIRGRSTHRLADVGASGARYVTSGAAQEAGVYRVVNYAPFYYLLPPVDHDAFWRSIGGYHEHLPIAEQDENASRVSNWLAQDVLGPLGRSFLEVGCGAGRNLAALRGVDPDFDLAGIEVNEQAATIARETGSDVAVGSLYDLSGRTSDSADVVFTSGVLMHVPHDRVESVIAGMHRIASVAVVHFELHGPSHGFDFHRYPRDYAGLYGRLGYPHSYETFPHNDFRSASVAPFHHALLVSKIG